MGAVGIPDLRSGTVLGYDASRGQAIVREIESGEDAPTLTWVRTNSGWQRADDQKVDFPDSNAAWDPSLDEVVVLAGGGTGAPGDLWGWNGCNWVPLPNSTTQFNGSVYLVFDGARKQLLMVDPSLGETLAYTQSGWTHEGGAPSGNHELAGVTYDPMTRTVLLVGGMGYQANNSNETWSWDARSWTLLHPAHVPNAGPASLAYVSTLHGAVLLEGENAPSMWLWDGNDWSQMHPQNLPLSGGQMVYDQLHDRLVLLAGSGQFEIGSQTWEYANGAWSRP